MSNYYSTCVLDLDYHWRGFNTLRPRRDGRHFPDDIFNCIFLNEKVWILIQISLKFVPKGPINNIPSLVQMMAWRRPGDKPSSEPMMVSLLTHICVTLPQWVNKQRVLMHGHQGWNVRHGLCHIYMIYVYILVVYSFCLFCCLFIIVTTQFVALYKPCKPKPKPSAYDPPDNHPLAEIQIPILTP